MPDGPPIRALSFPLSWSASTGARADGSIPHMDEAGFRALYEKTARPLWRYLCHASANPALADDLLQDTFCRFLAARPPVMDEAQTRSYLYRIASNLLRDRWRRGEPGAPLPVPELAVRQDLDSRLAVRAALAKVKPRERQLLWLAYVEGFSHHEIAHATGLRSASVRLLLFRARRRLATMLGSVGQLGGSKL